MIGRKHVGRKQLGSRGFTLVELMIVVAIIGVLAALAIYGVRRYLASAKTSEAKNTIGSIARSAQGAFEREQNAAELLGAGSTGTQLSHDLCASSFLAPSNVPAGQKITPGDVFETDTTGSSTNVGWKCLKFSISNPVYYQYGYSAARITATIPTTETAGTATAPTSLTNLEALPSPGFWAFANGDLDGDTTQSAFGIVGAVDTGSRQIRVGTQIYVTEEYE